MGKSRPPKVHRYCMHFKATAVRLQLKSTGVELFLTGMAWLKRNRLQHLLAVSFGRHKRLGIKIFKEDTLTTISNSPTSSGF